MKCEINMIDLAMSFLFPLIEGHLTGALRKRNQDIGKIKTMAE